MGASPKSTLQSSNAPFPRERQGLAQLLSSGEFSRSPNLEKIIVYLCEKYFQGESSSIKEYHLATEVLGRPESFDPKRDSIVRVELHRLRRRLKEIAAKSPPEAVRILLPEKSYRPDFRLPPEPETAIAVIETASLAEIPFGQGSRAVMGPAGMAAAGIGPAGMASGLIEPGVVIDQVPKRHTRMPLVAAGTLFLGMVALGFWYRQSQPEAAVATKATVAEPVAALPVGDQIRILAGRPGTRHVDSAGRVWEGDRYFTGGEAVSSQGEIRTLGFDHDLFSGYREGNFQYDIPLKPGVYEATFLFAETQYGENSPGGGGEAYRVFSISANGRPLADEIDIMAQTMESHTAAARRFRRLEPAQDGQLHLRFSSGGSGKAFVNAIVIEPGLPNAARPLRMVARPKSLRDANQVTWEPEHFYRGGVQITRPHGAATTNGDIYRGERYGRFAYSIPVPPGHYTAHLYFWEYWWGPNNPGKGGAGSRLFDVFCNYRALLTDFDIIRVNPAQQSSIQTFRGLEPDARGQLLFDFVPKRNYAMVNAIEILDEGK